MTSGHQVDAADIAPIGSMRRLAFVAGLLYLITFITSIPALFLKGPLLNDSEFVIGTGNATSVTWGGYLEVLLAISCIGTAVVLYPVARRISRTAALGFLAARLFEGTAIMIGAMSVLAVVTMRQDVGSLTAAETSTLLAISASFVAVHDWSFLLGPGLIPAINALLLGYVMYRARLVPRMIPAAGLVGAPLLFASATATVFGVHDQVSVTAALAALPIAFWELSLGVWLVVKGFNGPAESLSSPATSGTTTAAQTGYAD